MKFKPRMKCQPRHKPVYGQPASIIRLEPHPRLGDPNPNKVTKTSKVIRVSLGDKEFETENSIYYWDAEQEKTWHSLDHKKL